ncbi:hypothetical protein DFJ77DRAFT_506528 [Powellomyces hirtus]|nr:hypothetical protein DFJ77DRAFT_506528 [Powellomyces hirtus]
MGCWDNWCSVCGVSGRVDSDQSFKFIDGNPDYNSGTPFSLAKQDEEYWASGCILLGDGSLSAPSNFPSNPDPFKVRIPDVPENRDKYKEADGWTPDRYECADILAKEYDLLANGSIEHEPGFLSHPGCVKLLQEGLAYDGFELEDAFYWLWENVEESGALANERIYQGVEKLQVQFMHMETGKEWVVARPDNILDPSLYTIEKARMSSHLPNPPEMVAFEKASRACQHLVWSLALNHHWKAWVEFEWSLPALVMDTTPGVLWRAYFRAAVNKSAHMRNRRRILLAVDYIVDHIERNVHISGYNQPPRPANREKAIEKFKEEYPEWSEKYNI